MPQSLARILIHLIFSTKDRTPLITDELRGPLHGYIVGSLRHLGCPSLQTGSSVDHVHSLLLLARTRTVADVVEEIKTGSSRWMKNRGVRAFAWQTGYGAFSIGESQVPALVRYIADQERHHRRLSFQDELHRFLDRYGVAYDEQYLWE